MHSVGTFELKTHTSEILSKVIKGEIFTVTKHGKPIAKIIPFQEEEPDLRLVAKRIREIRSEIGEKGVDVSKLIREGRRY